LILAPDGLATCGFVAGHLHGVPRRDLPGPRGWAEQVYPNLVYFHEAARGGHFAACEEPDLFAAEIRAAFRSVR